MQEQAVFRWVLRGKRDPEIAILLGANPRTTEKHVAKILEKYGTETRSGAIGTYYDIELAKLARKVATLEKEKAQLQRRLARVKRAFDSEV